MKLHRPVLSALALSFALPLLAPVGGAGTAEAADRRRPMRTWEKILKAETEDVIIEGLIRHRLGVAVNDDTTIASVTAELESDAGDEELPLVETDAWLHGAATLSALPAADADLTVTIYDTGSAALISFSGTLGADGSVTLAAENTKYDIELLAAEVFTAETGFDLSVDLAGADTYEVAYASITVTEGGAVCLATDEKGNCLKWDTSKEVSTRSELYWDEIGSIWEADATLAHEGLIEVKVKTYDGEGEKLATSKAKLGTAWMDDGTGVNSLATDEDPLTRVAFHRGRASYHKARAAYHSLTVVSEGWTVGDAIPVDAEVELTNGETITIPVNSYQRTAPPTRAEAEELFDLLDAAHLTFGDGRDTYTMGADEVGFFELGAPLCSDSVCVTVTPTADGYELSATAYGADAGALPDEVEVSLTITDSRGASLKVPSTFVTLDDEITGVFSNEVSFAGDPLGLGLSGTVKLLGAPNREGKQETLAKGKFYAELSRDGDGDLALAGGDKDEVVSSGDAVVAGEAIGLDDGQGGLDTPPVIVYGVSGNGSGTKNASSQTSTRPQLL